MTSNGTYSPKSNGSDASKKANQWIFITKDEILESDQAAVDGDCQICQLRHPKTGEGAMFLFRKSNASVYEITSFKEECRSWFIDDSVQEDGSLYITTEIDPLYLILPYLLKESQSGKSMPLDLVLQDEDFPEMQRISSCVNGDQLSQLADIKGDADLQALKYSKEKTQSWLRSKVENVADALEKKNMHVGEGAQLSSYFRHRKNASVDQEEYMRYAFGLVSDYLPMEVSADLKNHLGIKDPIVEKSKPEEPPLKRAKTDPVLPTEDYTSSNGKALLKKSQSMKLTAAQKKLSQVDKSGMKNMFSFFKKK